MLTALLLVVYLRCHVRVCVRLHTWSHALICRCITRHLEQTLNISKHAVFVPMPTWRLQQQQVQCDAMIRGIAVICTPEVAKDERDNVEDGSDNVDVDDE